MKIQIITTKEVKQEIELETPAYFKTDNKLAAFYSEDNIIVLTVLTSGYIDICKCRYESMYLPERILDGERITEDDFNVALSEAISLITAAYLSPLPILETA